jgi:hypothetical protein
MKKITMQKSLLAISITAILTGCGGGGGGGETTSSSIDATIQGKAAKGIIIGGDVVADEMNGDGTTKNANVGSAITGSDGKYSLDLNGDYEGGPIRITVSKNANTTTVCDAPSGCGPAGDLTLDNDPQNGTVDFGEQYKPTNLSMIALVPDAEDGETIDVQVTPFTNLAAQQAIGTGSLSVASITAANSEVSALLGGVDILRTEPVDITNLTGDENANAVAYAALSAAIIEAAADGTNEPDIESALNDLVSDFTGGQIQADDLEDIITDSQAVFTEVGAVDTSGLLADLQADVDDASGGVIDPEPNENAGDSDVELAKAFISDLRTWGTVIDAEITQPSLAFEEQVDMVNAAAELINEDVADDAISIAATVIGDVFDEVTGADANTLLTNYPTDFGTFTGTVVESIANGQVTYTITNASVTVPDEDPVDISLSVIAPNDGAELTSLDFGILYLNLDTPIATWVVDSGSITFVFAEAWTVDLSDEAGDPPVPDSIAFDFDASITRKIILVEDAPQDDPDPLTFNGRVAFTLYPTTDSTGDIISALPGSLTLGGSVSNASDANSFDFNFGLSILDAANIDPVNTPLEYASTYFENNGDYLIKWSYTEGDTFTYTSPDYIFTATLSAGDVMYSFNYGSSGASGTVTGPFATIEDFVAINPFFINYTYQVDIDGQGEYDRDTFASDYSSDGFDLFILDEPEVVYYDESNPLEGSAGLQFTAQLDGLPEADISITANATDFEAGNADLTVSYGLRSLSFDISNDTLDGEVGSVTITNQDGLELILNFDNFEDEDENNDVQEVTINDKKVADLEDIDNGLTKVSYIDGTFEIF